ncbi:MAG: DUF3501 family protein [Actinomycetota bacterium]|jgi:hypothetical protein|nr:DUF3501 family protein [Actinomycetota bacterium]
MNRRSDAMSRALQLDDIMDLRAYERERDDVRRDVMALKRRRRVTVGPVVSLVFENRQTVLFQVHEMVRAERIASDDAVLEELRAYNPLIPEPGELSATLFIELTDDEQLRTWLPRLVGIERTVELRLAGGARVRSVPEAGHEAQLTRAEITPAVHYLRWAFSPAEVAEFAGGPVALAVDHPEYRHEVDLPAETRAELLADLRG